MNRKSKKFQIIPHLDWNFRVFLDSLHRHDIGLQIAGHPDQPVEGLRHGQGVADRESSLFRGDAPVEVSSDHGEKPGKECDEIPNQFHPYGKPSKWNRKY